ncbi:DUF3949 domain-containing protein [Paenibacillus sp. D2_2]|uniref:DUF3949 domain-containing protein n=1 Tax=Paenibacillus sp. D2_2 TaxID=3073092 RepID=UPI0028167504|nr:DUF3949 domain-containing protein [Paenibacillus sp. D2_2]WMT39873.1 DUF3949 domain-containing protein [Paenibacillus sp. D2_2]
MESWIIWTIGSCLVAYFIFMVVIQYQYLGELRKKQHKNGEEQNAYYEKMSFEEEQLHYRMQSFWPAAAVAALIYKMVRLFKKNSTTA